MLEQLVAGLVDKGCGGVALEIAGSGDLAGEVVAGVEEFEETTNCFEVFVYEVDSALLFLLFNWIRGHVGGDGANRKITAELVAGFLEPGTCDKKPLMSC